MLRGAISFNTSLPQENLKIPHQTHVDNQNDQVALAFVYPVQMNVVLVEQGAKRCCVARENHGMVSCSFYPVENIKNLCYEIINIKMMHC